MPAISARRLSDHLGDQPLRTPSSPAPAYRVLADRIRALLVDGRLPDGTRLPSERELAQELAVSRTTTTRAYAQLRESGLLVSRRGSGSLVRVPVRESTVGSLIGDRDDDLISLSHAVMSAPTGLGARFESAVERLPSLLAGSGYLPDGLPLLRELLAQRYSDAGLPTDPAQIIVTNGAVGATTLVARALLGPGRRVLVEGIGYPHAYDALRASGARLVPLPAGDDPWDTAALESMLGPARIHAAHLIPDFHNPTGALMDEDTRVRWARLLRRHEVPTLIDETLRPVNLDGVDLPASFATGDRSAFVIGSASKEFWAGLRLGWVRVPHAHVTSMLQTRISLDLGSSAFDQLVLADLIADGDDIRERQLQRARHQRDHLVASLKRRLPQLRFTVPQGGLSLWASLPDRNCTALAVQARRFGLDITAGPRFHAAAGGEDRLRLPFTLDPDELDHAIRRLALAADSASGTGSAQRADRGVDLIA